MEKVIIMARPVKAGLQIQIKFPNYSEITSHLSYQDKTVYNSMIDAPEPDDKTLLFVRDDTLVPNLRFLNSVGDHIIETKGAVHVFPGIYTQSHIDLYVAITRAVFRKWVTTRQEIIYE